VSKFALAGAHRGLDCGRCHDGAPEKKKISSDCASCHRLDDDHRGRYGLRCGECHGAKAWTPARFRHDRDTDFKLLGAHREARCDGCHKATMGKERMPAGCYSCHRGDDVHSGQQGRNCRSCHDERGWEGKVFFDHELTRFPLLGLHALASCEACHESSRFRDADRTCAGCHADADHHTGRLGEDCGRCHAPNGWRVWKFDHDRETSFALRGAHDGLDCHACHARPARGGIHLSRRCDTCHARDDAHSGSFGGSCDQCHTQSSWREVTGIR